MPVLLDLTVPVLLDLLANTGCLVSLSLAVRLDLIELDPEAGQLMRAFNLNLANQTPSVQSR